MPDLGPGQHRRGPQDQPRIGRVPVEGDIDLLGILGLSDEVRNGYQQIRVSFRVRGDASPEALRQLVEQAAARSAVYDVLTHGVPISVDVAAALTRHQRAGNRTMRAVETLVVGAGQAGLAVSRCLTARAPTMSCVERGRVAERWRSARWDSLRLLTPNWMSRLPAWSYPGPDPDGYMAAPELVGYLEDYAGSFAAPVHENTTVELVEAAAGGLRVVTDQRTWLARNVVVATGTENRAYVPPAASGIDPEIHQLTAARYRGPGQVPDGGVLVVGASASGVQIADELRRAGRPVVISVGRHARLPRRYRGRDILWWMDQAGILGQTIDQVHDARVARRAPSLQLSGRADHPVGLDALAARGVRLAGRLVAADGRRLRFADDLPATIAGAQARMERLLRTIDGYIAHRARRGRRAGRSARAVHGTRRPGRARPAPGRHRHRDLGDRLPARPTPGCGFPSWTGTARSSTSRGVTSVPGLYVLGLQFQHRRNSTFVDGVAQRRPVRGRPRDDAADGRPRPGAPDSTEQSMSTTNTQHYDVVIAGARCAGAATALLLARQGARVLVLDESRTARTPCRPTRSCGARCCSCTGGDCSPPLPGREPRPFGRTTFHLADAVTTIPVKPRHGVEALYAPRRTRPGRDPGRRRGGAGADVRFGATVTGLRRDRAGRVTGITGRAGAARAGGQRRPGRRRRRPPLGRRAARRRQGRPRRAGLERPHLPVRPCGRG